MNEKQSMLVVIGMQTMKITMLSEQIAALQAENEELKQRSVESDADKK